MFLLAQNVGDLQNMSNSKQYSLDIDNEKQTIQGVFIPDKTMFQQIRGAVQATHLDGWEPSSDDIKKLKANAMNPDPKELARIKAIWEQRSK